MTTRSVEIVEVGPRDGFQSVEPIIPTPVKIAIVDQLYAAGVRRMEATSFVSASAVPQLADAGEIVTAVRALAGLDAQILVPTERYAERALLAGADHLAFVLSVSERHNLSNVRRSPAESAQEYRRIVRSMPNGTRMRLNIATAFDCPYEGRIDEAVTLRLLEELIATAPNAEVALCDTTGRVTPGHVEGLFSKVRGLFPETVTWAFHAHDTFGLGAANTLAAWQAGVCVFDASVAGLGGCPFAPGATGNVATEDLLWMFQGMDVATGIDFGALVAVARRVADLPGAQVGGRVRDAMSARADAEQARAAGCFAA